MMTYKDVIDWTAERNAYVYLGTDHMLPVPATACLIAKLFNKTIDTVVHDMEDAYSKYMERI